VEKVRPSSPDLSERISRFEAAIARLETSRRRFAGRRPLYVKCFLALTAAGFACFVFGGLVGLWGAISATVVSVAGYGMVRVRSSELEVEIDALQREIDRMRAAGDEPP
jgi:uncharacterized small protein (DUF1192 family)